jgi:hypothetical protein
VKDSCRQHTKNDGSWWEHDARGIPLTRVCGECRHEKLSGFRSDVLSNPNYHSDEPIDED